MKFEAYLQHGTGNGPFKTESVPVKISELAHPKRGMQYTATGYGAKIPSRFMVKWNDRWRRVYVTQYSNVGSFWIQSNGNKIAVALNRCAD